MDQDTNMDPMAAPVEAPEAAPEVVSDEPAVAAPVMGDDASAVPAEGEAAAGEVVA